MTSAHLTRFAEQRPFEPFIMVTADGRELHAPHPEYVSLGEYALSITLQHPNGQVEVIGAAHIVSIRTIYTADAGDYRK
jgi:hypothetical protein